MFPSVLFSLFDINMFRISSKMDLKCFYICVMAVFVVPGRAFQGNMSITGNTELRGNIMITCSWILLPNETFINVALRSLPVSPNDPNYFYYQFNRDVSWAARGSQFHDRTSYENFTVTSSNNQAIMRISNVQCSDGQNYSCYFTIGQQDSQYTFYERTSYLEVKARPKAPTISFLTNMGDDILEFSNISAVCASNVGRPGRGSLQWKIYRSGVPEVLLPTDPRLDALKTGTLQPWEDNCTQRVEQTFRMRVSRSDQNLLIVCFVQNDDFQSQTPDTCQNPATDLCGQTKTLRIVYGVNETDMTVESDPPGSVYQDMTVTLTCQASGLPTPVYTWTQVVDDNNTTAGNNTLTGQLVNDKYQLVLDDLVAYGGQELKYACIANNTVLTIPYSVTKEITFQVLMTTTTMKPTTTTTTPTTATTTKNTNATNEAGLHADDTGDGNKNTIIIVVVVVVGSLLIIAIIIGIIFWRKRRYRKEVEEPPEKPSTNRTNLSYQSSQPDLVADKKFTNPSLDNSFSEKKEDGLMYADLTYDNRPRSRKPMAINDTSSEYSDIQMPQV